MSPSGRVDASALPKPSPDGDDTMKCAMVVGFTGDKYGQIHDLIKMSTSAPKPALDPRKKQILIRVLVCSLAAGDTLTLSGNMIMIKPKLPYVPGMDVCGVVQEVTNKVTQFKAGDLIVASNGLIPVGGMAEYAVVDSACAVLKPPSVDILQAASSPVSAVTAAQTAAYVNEGDRVLVLGGSGGVGSAAISLAKNAGASFVATTSTQTDLCTSLGADRVIDYREHNWWEFDEFCATESKFDKIIDCVGGGNFYGRGTCVLKTGKERGKFIAVVGDQPRPDLSSWFKVIKYMASLPKYPLWTSICKKRYPRFIYIFPPSDAAGGMARVLKLMEEGKLKIPLDPASPHDFTEEGIKSAFEIQGSGHAHGKVCVRISDV